MVRIQWIDRTLSEPHICALKPSAPAEAAAEAAAIAALAMFVALLLLAQCTSAVAPLSPPSVVGCPGLGCDAGRTNFQAAATPAAAAVATGRRLPLRPRPVWSWRAKQQLPEPPQCAVGQTGDVVCTLASSSPGQHDGGLLSLRPGNGSLHWRDSRLKGTRSFPVLSLTGDAISSDGRALVGTNSDGSPTGAPIALFLPPLYSLTLTIEGIIPLLPRYVGCAPWCGALITYISNGIPHARDSLNDTASGQCFNAITMPVVNVANQTDESTTRIYILTASLPPTPASDLPTTNQSHATELVPCRLIAEDVASSMNDRLAQVWAFDFLCVPPQSLSEADAALLLLNNTIYFGGVPTVSVGPKQTAGLFAVADDGPAPRLVATVPLGSSPASLTYQPELQTLWLRCAEEPSLLRGFDLASTGGVPSARGSISMGDGAVISSAVVAAADAEGSPALVFMTRSNASRLMEEVVAVRSPSGSVAWRAPLLDEAGAPLGAATPAVGGVAQRLIVAEAFANGGGGAAPFEDGGPPRPVVVVSTGNGVVGLADPV